MSFITKFVAGCTQNGVKKLHSNITSTWCARKFHVMVKPLPISETTKFIKNPIANDVVSPLSLTTGLQRLLSPLSSFLNQVSGFKVKGHLRRRCKDCYFVIRQQRLYVICPTHRRHKQMAMKKRDYKDWILTHATQSKVRPY